MPRSTRWGGVRFRQSLLICAAVVEVSALGGLAWGRPAFPSSGLLLFGLAFLAYAVAAVAVGQDREGHADRGTWVLIWGAAIAARLLLLPAEPRLSDDIWRYLWDGHVQLAGENPFRFAPADMALEAIRTPWHGLINNPTVSTIYPPVAQVFFGFIAILGGTVTAAKTVWIALDLCAVATVVAVARALDRPAARVAILYAWSPLLIVETAWSGHLEPLGVLWLCLFLLFLARDRAILAGGVLAAAVLTKFAPIAALPAVARKLGWQGLAVVALGIVALYLPYLAAGDQLWSGLTTYARHWRFNAGAFALVEWAFPGPVRPRIIAAVVVLLVVLMTTLRSFAPDRALLWILGTGIALSPTVHPWYLLWILPLAALRLNWAWLYLSGSVFLGYWSLDTFERAGEWPEPLAVRLLVWTPFFGLLVWQLYRDRSAGEGADAEP